MEELGVIDSISDSWSWPFVFCSLTDTLFCTIRQKDPALTAAFDHRVHLTSSVILAASQSYCWCSWGNEHPVKNGAEKASAFLHLSVSGQERSLLMTSSFKGSWQANVTWPRQSCSSVPGNNLGKCHPLPVCDWRLLICSSSQSTINLHQVPNPTLSGMKSLLLFITFTFFHSPFSSYWNHL